MATDGGWHTIPANFWCAAILFLGGTETHEDVLTWTAILARNHKVTKYNRLTLPARKKMCKAKQRCSANKNIAEVVDYAASGGLGTTKTL